MMKISMDKKDPLTLEEIKRLPRGSILCRPHVPEGYWKYVRLDYVDGSYIHGIWGDIPDLELLGPYSGSEGDCNEYHDGQRLSFYTIYSTPEDNDIYSLLEELP